MESTDKTAAVGAEAETESPAGRLVAGVEELADDDEAGALVDEAVAEMVDVARTSDFNGTGGSISV